MSGRRLLVCDIQGVGCYYTDPQIHSVDGEAFGSGNCGLDGVRAFFESHRCNSLCRRMGQSLVCKSLLKTKDSVVAGVRLRLRGRDEDGSRARVGDARSEG